MSNDSCYDDKVAMLKERLRGVAKFDNLEQAEAYSQVHKQPANSPAWRSLCGCAEKVLLFQDQLGVRDVLDGIGGCDRTRLSAIRDAYRQLAIERLERHQAHLDRQLECEPLPKEFLATSHR